MHYLLIRIRILKKELKIKQYPLKSPIDRVYLNSSNDCYLEDKKFK